MDEEKEKQDVTPEQLRQLRALNREVKAQKDRLTQLQALCQGKRVRAEGLPYLSPEQAQQQYLPQIRQLQGQIAQNLDRCLQQVAWLEQYIAQVKDSRMRQILSLRYISGLTWQQVAFRIGEYDEQVPRKIHKQFFAAQGKEKRNCR